MLRFVTKETTNPGRLFMDFYYVRLGVMILLLSVTATQHSYAVNASPDKTQEAPQLAYYGELGLVYIDKLHNPAAQSSYPNLDLSERDSRRSSHSHVRSLGLARMILGIDYRLPHESRVHVLLRPDVLNRTEDYSDFDSRAGKVYFKQTKVKFVDEYFLTLDFDDSLLLNIGVFEKLSERYLAYPALLEFGLEVRFPERFAGARFDWQQTRGVPATQDDRASRGWYSEFWVLQGNEDRVENQSTQSSTQDNAPESQDAHLGVAAAGGFDFNDKHRIGVMVGMGKNEYERELDESGVITAQKGKREEIYGQLFDSYYLALPLFSTKFALDYRIMKEKWKSDIFQIQPRTHQSLSFSASTEVYENIWMFTGFFAGTSKMQDELVSTGYQLDLGFVLNPKKHFYITTMASEEHRDHERDGSSEGGFVLDGKESGIVRRFALELKYLFQKG